MTTSFLPAPRFVGFAHGAPRELLSVDDLDDVGAGRPLRLADAYTRATPPRGLSRRELPSERTTLLAREIITRAKPPTLR